MTTNNNPQDLEKNIIQGLTADELSELQSDIEDLASTQNVNPVLEALQSLQEFESEQIAGNFNLLLKQIRNNKPNDRSGVDKAYAVTITDLEKLVAYFQMYVVNTKRKPGPQTYASCKNCKSACIVDTEREMMACSACGGAHFVFGKS